LFCSRKPAGVVSSHELFYEVASLRACSPGWIELALDLALSSPSLITYAAASAGSGGADSGTPRSKKNVVLSGVYYV
jgi:hypothetical protein